MVAPTPLKAGGANLAATLDLSRIQSLAISVASQTGLGAVPVNVAVTASAVVAVGSAKPVRTPPSYPSSSPPWKRQWPVPRSALRRTDSLWCPRVRYPNRSGCAPLRLRAPRIRLGLLALLLLAVAATAVIWPHRPLTAPPETPRMSRSRHRISQACQPDSVCRPGRTRTGRPPPRDLIHNGHIESCSRPSLSTAPASHRFD